MRLKVNVEQIHIDAGIPDRQTHCPLGLAITKSIHNTDFGDFNPHLFNDGTVMMVNDDDRIDFELPRSARRFEARVVKGLPVKPFSFYLEL
jgi:hypothetical protein